VPNAEFVSGDAPIDPVVLHELLEPFIAATTGALAEMAGAEIGVRAIRQELTPADTDGLTAVVELESATAKALVLAIPRHSAAILAERVLAGAANDIEELLVGDVVGEVANVIAGQAKAMLAGSAHQLTFRIPKVLSSAGGFRPPPGLRWFVVAFDSEWGEFAMAVGFPCK
jgi:chemotaxis protein CheX